MLHSSHVSVVNVALCRLCARVPQEWTKDDCVQILEAVVERAPALARIPLDLRTRSVAAGSVASTSNAHGDSGVAGDASSESCGEDNDENDECGL